MTRRGLFGGLAALFGARRLPLPAAPVREICDPVPRDLTNEGRVTYSASFESDDPDAVITRFVDDLNRQASRPSRA